MVENREKTPFLSGALVRIRLEIEKNTLFGRAFVRIRSKIEKNTLFSRAFVRIWSIIEKNTLFKCGLGYDKVRNREKHPFWYDFS